ncbi:MAG: 2-hydroxyacid dehydrogenase [Verrucomicrobiota bacterium]
MKTAIFSTKDYELPFFEEANEQFEHELTYLEARLSPETVELAKDYPCVCAFVSDELDREVIDGLAASDTRLISLRSAGFNHVDLEAAAEHDITVVRVPAYSPNAVAEHAVTLMLALNRGVHRAYNRTRDGNFGLGGLMGSDMGPKTVGIIGTGKIGESAARILRGFGCRLLAFDPVVNETCKEMGVEYVELPQLLKESDIITIHCPLNPKTHHLIDMEAVDAMKRGAMLVNTSRGGVVETRAVIEGLKSGQIGHLGLDVYEEEDGIFFRDLSSHGIPDDLLARLVTFPNVIVTGHQAFFTREAVRSITEVTLQNIREVEETGSCDNEVSAKENTQ